MRGLRLIALALSGLLLIATWAAPAFRSADGALAGRFVVPLAAASAFGAVAVLATAARLRALLWMGLAVTGQAVWLQLVRAGPGVGYQHLVPWPQLLSGANALWTAWLVAQTAVVAIAVRPLLSPARRWLGENLPSWRGFAVIAFFLLTGAAVSRQPSQFAIELVLAGFVQLVALCTVVLAVASLPAADVAALGRAMDRWLGDRDDDGGGSAGILRVDCFALLAAAWAVAVTALLNVVAYERHPHVPDDVVYLLHARYFARGMLAMPAPPVPEAFDLDLMTFEATRWYSPVPPGWPAVLAIGAALGLPWLVNPVLSGLAVLLAYVFLRDLYGVRTARIGTLLLCASPWFLFMGMSFMTHQLTLVAALAAGVCAARLRNGGAVGWAVPAGIGLGVIALGRPLEGFTIAVLIGLWTLLSKSRLRPGAVVLMAAAAIATTAITLPYNRYLTGSATVFPIMAYTDALYGAGSNALGFGPDRGIGWSGLDPFPGHGWRDILVNTNLNVFQVATELAGWSTGSVLLIALLLFSRRMRRPHAWMLVTVVAIIGMHALYWFSGGPDFGARYWYLILVPCVALAVGGLQFIADTLDPAHRPRVLLAAGILCACAVLVFVPWRAADKYHHYRGMRPDIRRIARDRDFGRSLVLVRGGRHPDYASAAAYNPIDLRADAPVYAWDRSADVRLRVLQAYGDRPVWIVDGPTLTGDGYRVSAGPVPAATLIAESSGAR